jgi:hypothetical protein
MNRWKKEGAEGHNPDNMLGNVHFTRFRILLFELFGQYCGMFNRVYASTMFKLNTDYCLLRRHRVLKSGTG